MRQAYEEWSPSADVLKLVLYIDQMCGEYQAQGLMLSVRQLYYQLVARGMIENTERSYQRIVGIITRGRMAGYIDWDAIEDRGRDIELRTRWESATQIVRASARSFHQDLWVNQTERVFVMVEKAALAGVLTRVCEQYDVPLLACRGYPSVSVVRELVMDHIVPALEADQVPVLLHLGDHDPSGIDMTRDLDERIKVFADVHWEQEFDVDRIALTMRQIEEVKPPENPAKSTDSRFQEYRRRFGTKSWELDALDPAYLMNLVETNIRKSINATAWEERRQEIEAKRAKIQKVADKFAKENA